LGFGRLWCCLYFARNVNYKSDDVIGRAATYEAIIRGEKIKSPNVPAAFNVILKELQALGLAINLLGVKTEEGVEEQKEVEKKE